MDKKNANEAPLVIKICSAFISIQFCRFIRKIIFLMMTHGFYMGYHHHQHEYPRRQAADHDHRLYRITPA